MSRSNSSELSIIIISYNVKDKVIRCLEELSGRFSQWQVVVIDNNSQDGSFRVIKDKFKRRVSLNKNNENLGFSKAVNQGIKKAKSEFILLLNPDTIPSIKAIKKLVEFLGPHPDIGIVGGRLDRPHVKGDIYGTFVNRPDFLTGLFDFTNLRRIFPHNRFHRAFYYRNEKIMGPRDVWGVSGAFMVIRKEVIDKIGGLDENFFMYLEDVDFGVRAKQAGFRVVFYPNVGIIHESGSSSPNKYHINVRAWRKSRKYFFRKHLGFFRGNMLKMIFTFDELITDLLHLIK